MPPPSKPKYRIHIRWFNGLDRYDESVTDVWVNTRARTISFRKVDGILISFPIEKLMFWETAEINWGGVKDNRLTAPLAPPSIPTRSKDLDWPTTQGEY